MSTDIKIDAKNDLKVDKETNTKTDPIDEIKEAEYQLLKCNHLLLKPFCNYGYYSTPYDMSHEYQLLTDNTKSSLEQNVKKYKLLLLELDMIKKTIIDETDALQVKNRYFSNKYKDM